MQPDTSGFITRAAALEAGYTDNELARMCRDGLLHKVAPGLFVPAETFTPLDERGRHVVRAHALTRRHKSGVVSHQSAAAVHGLDLWDTDLTRVHLTVPRATGGSRKTDRHIHCRHNIQAIQVKGIPTSSPADTVVDCARTLDLDHAVVIGDSALRKTSLIKPQLVDRLDGAAGMTGIDAAKRAVDLMDGLSESPGESLSRLRFLQHGIPMPVLQHSFPEFRVRVDFYWPKYRIIGEFDGMTKYKGSGAAYAEEKDREDALRSRGFLFIRWRWPHLATFHRVVEMFRRAVETASRR
ncbi:hypothetical protein [Rhodococcoides kyotonense]|uniref:Transcriptional regulator, AbiEi antitoxin, Type IV TA system n=1 Tax=Rhodococcoides kyotonense TaxID=398843 RepID=A0A239J218_9NOCA|nr:hypothetical protein [Rhodococcus kyotonensis]SNS99849.1 Transcriptional regulator, AbiEi antitoxin, Type IV TA system [Rhodococcus kyotonensis]